MLIKIIDDLNDGAYWAGSQYKMKREIGRDKIEKYFFSINAIWNRCHHHFIYGKKNRQYMQTGGFNVLSCILLFLYTIIYMSRSEPCSNTHGF
jgi:hypothetical protein